MVGAAVVVLGASGVLPGAAVVLPLGLGGMYGDVVEGAAVVEPEGYSAWAAEEISPH